jgi:hypothetical protein
LSKESCVEHPAGEWLVIFREWQVEACDGNHCAAALLSFFEFQHNGRLMAQQQAAGRNRIAREHRQPEVADQAEDLWQHWNEDELAARLLFLYSVKTIRAALLVIDKKKFIKIGGNPDPRMKGDRTKWYLFQPKKVNLWIERYNKRKAGKTSAGGSTGQPATRKAIEKDTANLPDGSAKRPNHDPAILPEGCGKIAGSSMHVDGEHESSMHGGAPAPDSPPTEDQLKDWRIRMFFEHLGHKNYSPTFGQCALIIAQVTLIEAWKEALEVWRDNNYVAQNITGLLSRYSKLLEHYRAQAESAKPAPRYVSAPSEMKEKATAEIRAEIESIALSKIALRAEDSGEPYTLDELMGELQQLFCASYQFLQPIIEPLLASNEA